MSICCGGLGGVVVGRWWFRKHMSGGFVIVSDRLIFLASMKFHHEKNDEINLFVLIL